MIKNEMLVRNEIKRLDRETGLDTSKLYIKINGRFTRCLGRFEFVACPKDNSYEPCGFQFGKKFLETATEEEILEITQHEYAHYVQHELYGYYRGMKPHGEEFQNACDLINCKDRGASRELKNPITRK